MAKQFLICSLLGLALLPWLSGCAGTKTLSGAGATFPYGEDPRDSNIRIAPSLPPVEELQQAIAIFCICVKLAALEKLGV